MGFGSILVKRLEFNNFLYTCHNGSDRGVKYPDNLIWVSSAVSLLTVSIDIYCWDGLSGKIVGSEKQGVDDTWCDTLELAAVVLSIGEHVVGEAYGCRYRGFGADIMWTFFSSLSLCHPRKLLFVAPHILKDWFNVLIIIFPVLRPSFIHSPVWTKLAKEAFAWPMSLSL